MAVMANPLGGGGDLRGPIYVKEFAASGEPGVFTEVVNLAGPGRLIQAVGTRCSGNSYSVSNDNIIIKIIPDGDDSRALKKSWRSDPCSQSDHIPLFPMMLSLDFPEITNGSTTSSASFAGHQVVNYQSILSDRVVPSNYTVHGPTASQLSYSFSGNAEGISDSVVDSTLTIYQDGIYFDDSLVITGRWGRYLTGNHSFNGVILVYQIFQ